jgi:hypothetical protein
MLIDMDNPTETFGLNCICLHYITNDIQIQLPLTFLEMCARILFVGMDDSVITWYASESTHQTNLIFKNIYYHGTAGWVTSQADRRWFESNLLQKSSSGGRASAIIHPN